MCFPSLAFFLQFTLFKINNSFDFSLLNPFAVRRPFFWKPLVYTGKKVRWNEPNVIKCLMHPFPRPKLSTPKTQTIVPSVALKTVDKHF